MHFYRWAWTEYLGNSKCWHHQYDLDSSAREREWLYRAGEKAEQGYFFGVKYKEFTIEKMINYFSVLATTCLLKHYLVENRK